MFGIEFQLCEVVYVWATKKTRGSCSATSSIYFLTSLLELETCREYYKKYIYRYLVYTTQVHSAFRARWLASSEVISQVPFTSEQPKKHKMAFVVIFLQLKLLFVLLVIQLVWYILIKQYYSPQCQWKWWILSNC